MKKIFLLIMAVILNCNTAFAENNFLDADWWKTATVEDVQKELDNGADVNAKDGTGQTALMYATRNSSPEVAEVLINAGADVNAKDKNRRTALMYVVRDSSPAVVKMLISAEEDVNAKDDNGYTALMYAACPYTIHSRFGEDDYDKNILNENYLETVKLLIDAGAVVNLKDMISKRTSLMIAARCGFPDIVEVLIKAGADVNAKDRDENTALMDAAFEGSVDSVKLLLGAGADVNAQNSNGETALYLAEFVGNSEVQKILKGADGKGSVIKAKIDKFIDCHIYSSWKEIDKCE